eukprot:4089798-Amphidinium_carterae.1
MLLSREEYESLHQSQSWTRTALDSALGAQALLAASQFKDARAREHQRKAQKRSCLGKEQLMSALAKKSWQSGLKNSQHCQLNRAPAT